MQKGRVVSLRSFGIAEFLQKNSFLIVICIFLILGIIFGIMWFDDFQSLNDFTKEFVNKYITERSGTSFGKIFLRSTLDSGVSLFLLFLLGASLFGLITVPIAIMLRGFLQGIITAYLYSAYGLKGIAFNAVVFIPATIIFLIVMLIAARESIRFSMKISSLTLNKTLPFSLANYFRDYSIKYLIFMVVTLASSIVDASVSAGLIKNFSL